jgi:hypothetical protein
MAITNFDGIINARANGGAEDVVFGKTAAVGGVSGQWYSYMKTAGFPTVIAPANATAAGTIMTSTMAGAIPISTITTSVKKYLLTFGAAVSNANMSALMLADVLWAGANITSTTTAAQTINSTPLTRSTDGVGVQLMCVVSSALGATPSSFNIQYTASDDSTGNIDIRLTTAAAVNRVMPAGNVPFVPIPKAGVKSIAQCNVKVTMGSSGTLDLYLVKPLCIVPTIGANTFVERDTTSQIDGIVEIVTDSAGVPGCLGVFGLTSGTGTATLMGFIRTCKG